MNSLEQLFMQARVLICVGSGGVGKTTTASAIAFAAAQMGRRVLVLTIDPSKRLRTTMGLGVGQEIVQVEHPKILKTAGGALWAAVIDNKKTFDEFVIRASKDSQAAERLLNNKLYKQLSTTLSGSQEFTALEKLYSAVESGQYDLVVLDTPPAQHAIDFLEAPLKLSVLFQDSIAKWFRTPEKSTHLLLKLIGSGSQQVINALERLTGSEFMKSLTDFFQIIQGWQSRLEKRILAVQNLLLDPKTQFLLVTSLDRAKLEEARFFEQKIEKGNYHLAGIIINRAFPYWMTTADPGTNAIETQMRQYHQARESVALELLQSSMALGRFVVKAPELKHNVSDLETVAKMAEVLMNAAKGNSND